MRRGLPSRYARQQIRNISSAIRGRADVSKRLRPSVWMRSIKFLPSRRRGAATSTSTDGMGRRFAPPRCRRRSAMLRRAEALMSFACLIWVSRQCRMNIGDVTTRYRIEVVDAAVYDYIRVARRSGITC
jgi:hypothetical protein